MMKLLRDLAENLKISDIGVVRAKVFDDLCLDLRNKNSSEFVKAEPPKRSNPFLYMPEAKSVIVCLFSYNNSEKGNISKYAMGKDYHSVVREKLKLLAEPLKNAGYKCMVFSDSWDMNERYLAVAAGLGFIGKNHMLISPKYGSYVFIGAIITDCELEQSEPVFGKCAECNECIKNCPGGALAADGSFDESKCASYISQKKGELTKEEEKTVVKSGLIWGCDVCQAVCPHNIGVPYTQIDEFSKDIIINLDINEDMSNREFKRMYGERAFSWRGKSPIIRNKKILEREN